MRVLVSTNPLVGHLNAILPLAVAARAAGHDVVVATGPDLVPRVQRHGLPAWALGPPAADPATVPSWAQRFLADGEKRAVDLVPRAVDWRPDVVVHEETEVAGAVAAAAVGARHVMQGLGPMPPIQVWDSLAPVLDGLFARWDLPGGAGAVRAATYLDVCPPALRPAGEPIWPDRRPVRPLPGSAPPGERLPDAVRRLPYASTVHLTLGTLFHGATDVLAAAVEGLRELPLNLVVTVGPGSDPGRLGKQPAHVLVAPYLPHALLLPHCRLVVAHGGSGILLGALGHGIPQLALPQGADQHRNADALVRSGAGLALAAAEVTAEAVAAAARRLLAQESFAAAASAVRAQIAAMPEPATVLAALVR
jgi:UDP:flavonoid glycosyltransferase YjiC (YdhE family)